ncbi:MAG: preprotein translocase subunit SecG [Candidatus Riflebacteria bacterium]|nr:preprotein translocase subunit SecG [Candidatus Riflebacteria bacterium]
MITLLHIIHVAVCIGLIVIVLLQADKGEGLSGAFGGGASSTIFGERGGGGFMSKLTTTMAIVFMLTSLVIAVFVPKWQKNTYVNYSTPMSAPVSNAIPAANPLGMMPLGGGEIVSEESASEAAPQTGARESAPIDRADPPVKSVTE